MHDDEERVACVLCKDNEDIERTAMQQRSIQSALVKSSTRLELRQLIYISEYKFPFLSLYIIRQQLYRHSASQTKREKPIDEFVPPCKDYLTRI